MTLLRQQQSRACLRQELDALERALTHAWTGTGSTPFLAEAPLDADTVRRAEEAVRRTSLISLMSSHPTLAIWGVLTPLARDYGDSREVYRHIQTFAGEAVDDRDLFKLRYRLAARKIGLPVSGNDPTPLFFGPLGPPHRYHDDLAEAFVSASLALGPPATEDTPAARRWQRLAVRAWLPNHTRIQATINFDQSAWCAMRFSAWRRGAPPESEAEAHLFAAYDAAMARRGRQRRDLVGPPQVFWTGHTLGFEIEKATRPQMLDLGPQPRPVAGGARVAYPAPWKAQVRWSCGSMASPIAAGPDLHEVLVFNEAGGALLARTDRGQKRIEVAAQRHVVITRAPFTASSFGPALPAPDPDCYIAWTEAGDRLDFDDGRTLDVVEPQEAALWIDAPVLGRSGSMPLFGCDGGLELRLEPGLGSPERIIRARTGDRVRYASVTTDAGGHARLSLAGLALDRPDDPARIRFEALAPGAAGDLEARAELAVTAWIWPGVTGAAATAETLPAPGNFVAARSAALQRQGDFLHVDLRADVDAPILGLQDAEGVREFRLSVRGERLWHVRVGEGVRDLVPRRARLVFGHANRHDSLSLRSDDRDADLVVLGQVHRRPFLWRDTIEITSGQLHGAQPQGSAGQDDRIMLRRADGRHDILAHLIRIDEPESAHLTEDETGIRLSLGLPARPDALRIRIESATGRIEEGAAAFAGMPVDAPLPAGTSVEHDPETRRATIRIARPGAEAPAIARLFLRQAGGDHFAPILDADGAQFALAIDGTALAPDPATALRLARFLAEPAPAALGGQVERVIGPHYARAMDELGAARMVGRVKPVLALAREGDGVPRHDLIGVAPWLFEAPPSAFVGLAPASGLAALEGMRDVPPVDPAPPDPRGDRPLDAWLDRLEGGEDLPQGLDPDALACAVRSLRYRLRETELRLLAGRGPDAASAAALGGVHIEAIDRLRAFDHHGGGDDSVARLAALLERYARACALGEASQFLDRLAFRTGLPQAECGRIMTLILRAGCEVFAYFRALWHHAVKERDPDR